VYSEMWSPRQPAWAYLDEQIEYTGRTQLVLQAGVAKRDISFYLYKDPYTLTVERDGADLRSAGKSMDTGSSKVVQSRATYGLAG